MAPPWRDGKIQARQGGCDLFISIKMRCHSSEIPACRHATANKPLCRIPSNIFHMRSRQQSLVKLLGSYMAGLFVENHTYFNASNASFTPTGNGCSGASLYSTFTLTPPHSATHFRHSKASFSKPPRQYPPP
jgi:hypothetical protein